jgi:hypothetical protein
MASAIAKVLTRIEHVENLLAQGFGPREVAKKVRDEWGISRRHADRYVHAAFERWREEAQQNREDKRAHIRAMLGRTYRVAMSKTRTYQDPEGKVHEYDEPDIRGANSSIELIMRLEGLLQPDEKPTGSAIPAQLIVVLQQHYGIEPPKLDAGDTIVEMDGRNGEGDGRKG